jgi:nitrate reductase beta subunit
MSSFACCVWQRERLAPAWMTAQDGLLGTNDHGLGRQDADPLMPNVPNFFAPWTYDEILITVPAQQHTPVARPKSLLTGKDVKVE